MKIAKQIIDSEQYQNFIDIVRKKTQLRVLDDYKNTAEERDNKRIEVSGMTLDDFYDIFHNHKGNFSRFVFCKMGKYENIKIDEEYPSGEDNSGNNDGEENIIGYSRGFILMYLIEYFLLKNKPLELINYLKTMRIPNAVKYEKELQRIYTKNNGEG